MNDWRKRDGEGASGEEEQDVKGLEEDVENEPVLQELFLRLREDREFLCRESDLGEQPDLAGKLDERIRSGISQAEKRNKRNRGKRTSLQIAVVALSMLVLLTAFVRISPTFAAIIKEIPGFSGFVKLVSYDRSLQSAIDNEYIQLVNRSDERNGYKFTVNGVLADAQRVVLLYTAEGPGINEEDTTFLPYELKDENGGDIIAGVGSSHYFRETDDKDGGVQDYLDIMMSPGVPVPQAIQFKLEVGGEWLQVQVPIDQSRFAEMTETIHLNETIEVAGQRIEITQAVITPLQVSITFKSDSENTKRLNDFIDLELVDDRGRSYRTNSGMGNLDTEIVRHFQSSYFQKPKSLTLKANGLLMSDRGLNVVVDTEKGAMLKSPDARLKLKSVRKSADAVDLEFELSHTDDPPETNRTLVLFGYSSGKGEVKDAAGNLYSIEGGMSDGNVSSSFESGSRLATYYYNIPNADYVQPLTIEVDQYLGHTYKDITIPIK